MKNKIIFISISFLTALSTFAQKKELKTIKKALKNKDYTSAISKLTAIENSIKKSDDKYKSMFYFYKGQAYQGKNNLAEAGKAFNQLINFEKNIGTNKYTSKAKPLLETLAEKVSKKAFDLYTNKKDYKKAANQFYLTYELNPKDTTSIYNAAASATKAKDYSNALTYYKKLQDLRYTGIETQYLAKDIKGRVVNCGSKKEMDRLVKIGGYTNPKINTTSSKKGDIAKNIALTLKALGKTDEALKAISDARKANPKDDNLIFAAAEIYHKLNRMDEFAKLMKEAAELRPNDPVLFYNLAVVSANQGQTQVALKNYKKAISLKPDYFEANLNMAALLLSKDKEIVEQINKNLDNENKYNTLIKKQKELYKSALPYIEKADELKRNIETVKLLKNIYATLEITDKLNKYTKLYKSMR